MLHFKITFHKFLFAYHADGTKIDSTLTWEEELGKRIEYGGLWSGSKCNFFPAILVEQVDRLTIRWTDRPMDRLMDRWTY